MRSNWRLLTALTAFLCFAAVPKAFAVEDEPVNYDDPNLARTDDFANDRLDSCKEADSGDLQKCLQQKKTAKEISKAVKILVDANQDPAKPTKAAR